MEKQLNQKVSNFVNKFKEDVVNKIKSFDENKCSLAELIAFVYNKETITIEKQDLNKRKRIKNNVPFHERCNAIRANNEQCTRRKKDGEKFCGTHIKGRPHGEINEEKNDNQETCVKIQIWAEEISGIIHHLDDKNNVYDPQDIFQNKKNPKVIAHYTKEDGVYKLLPS
tara:strand:- start:6473 stop:6979 length:507 start_codon:yes stop_codon:yes gene_type:complete